MPAFAFRLHQFIGAGDAVYASLQPPGERHITLKPQRFVPGDRERVLEPMAFCRECGHEYYTVWRVLDPQTGKYRYTPRRLSDSRSEDGAEPGFLYANADDPWPADDSEEMLRALCPTTGWRSTTAAGGSYAARRDNMPDSVHVAPDGSEAPSGQRYQYVSAPLNFCLACGVHYPGRRNDFAKLSVLSTGGRATATTVLSLAAVRQLRSSDLPKRARKLLSFTDNRQDASLQAGHFNDFIDVGMLRGAVYRAALQAGDAGLAFDEVPKAVFDALELDFSEYAREPDLQVRRAHRGGARAARGAGLPRVPGPQARLAHHRAEPRAGRPARDRLRQPRRGVCR